MRVMALDIGGVRTGIAISDAQGAVATPLKVLPSAEVLAGAPSWRTLLQDWEPELLLCGLPLGLSGEAGPQTKKIRAQAEAIGEMAEIPVEFVDERLSSASAKRSLREGGLSEREMRGKVDMIAASLFLQAWLDARSKRHEGE